MRTYVKMGKLFVCLCLMITFMIENVSAAGTNTSSIPFSGYDFSVDSSLYSKTYVAGKYGGYQYNTASNQVTMYVTTRVWVCRRNDTKYEDVIYVKSKTSKYTVNLQYTIDVGATSGIYILKGGTSTSKITFSRTITTGF